MVMDMDRVPERYQGLAKRAQGDKKSALKAAVRLFCAQCYGWNMAEARACEATGCPLYAQHARIFRKGEHAVQDAS